MFVRRTNAGVHLWKADRWASFDIIHACTDRHGGVSDEPFRSLNLGLHVGDDEDRVRTNREKVCRALGVDAASLVVGEQVHGTNVARVDAAHRGRGARRAVDAIPGVDALITDSPGVVLFGLFADCVPVLLYDPERRAIGLAHAGWKGTVGHIAGGTVRAMANAFGSRPQACFAAIGPSIGPCCYEVGQDVAARFQEADATVVHRRGNGYYVDLWTANVRQLEAAGVPTDQITVARLCTRCVKEQFFSHRGDGGRTGRIAAAIGL